MPLGNHRNAEPDPRGLRLVGEDEAPPDSAGGLLVAEPRAPDAWLFGAVLIAFLAVGLFLWLNARRMTHVEPQFATSPPAVGRAQDSAIPELPADLDLTEPARPPPQPILPPPIFMPPIIQPAAPPLPVMEPQPARNLSVPALVIDFGPQDLPNGLRAGGIAGGGIAGGGPAGAGEAGGLEAAALGGGVGGADRVTATRLRNPGSVVPRGAIIPAVLETAIDSDLPGFARAVVSGDVLSFDGEHVLIPRGSRLIGRYKSDLVPGQSRVFIVWNSVIRPDGASIELSSPGTDELGRGGLEGEVDRRFTERYGGSLLLTTLSAGLNALSAARAQVMIAGGGIGATAASGSGGKPIGPVVKVRQGARIRVFVARELDFSTVGPAPANSAEAKP